MVQFRLQLYFVLCLLSAGVLAQVSPADLPACSLACWDQGPPRASSSPACVFTPDSDFESTYSPCFYANCPPKEALTALNMTSIICDVPVRDISLAMRVFVVVGVLLSSTVIGGRLILKLRSLAGEIGWDDWCIVAAVTVVMDAAVGQYLSAHYGLGRDQWKVPFEDIDKAFKSFYASTAGYKLGNMFTRMSVLCFYLRLFGTDDRFRYTIYGINAANIFIGISFVVIDLLQCRPVSYVWNGWDGEHEGSCISLSVITWTHSILNIILDVATLGMAIWMVKGLQMKLRRKAAVIGMLVLGSAITLVTFLRLIALKPLDNYRNRTWGMAPLAYWSAIEIAAGLILACLPALKKIRYIFRAKKDITNGSSTNNASGASGSGLESSKSPSRAVHFPHHLIRDSKAYSMIHDSKVDISSSTVELGDITTSGISRRHEPSTDH